MTNTDSRVTIRMPASLDRFVARNDGRVDWLKSFDLFAGGGNLHGCISLRHWRRANFVLSFHGRFADVEDGGMGLTKDDVLQTLRQAQASIRNLGFTYDLRMARTDGRIDPYMVHCEGLVTTDEVPRFRLHTTARIYCGPFMSIAEPSETVPSEHECAYDGQRGMQLWYDRRHPSGTLVPEQGGITDHPRSDQSCAFPRGLILLLPFTGPFNPPIYSMSEEPAVHTGLVKYLEHVPPEWGEWTVERTEEPNVLRLVVPYEKKSLHDIIDIDVERGASIVGFASWKNYGTPQAVRVAGYDNIVLKQFGDLWFPVSYERELHPSATLVTISYSSINTEVRPEDFRLTFPAGIPVVDSTAA